MNELLFILTGQRQYTLAKIGKKFSKKKKKFRIQQFIQADDQYFCLLPVGVKTELATCLFIHLKELHLFLLV